MATTVNTVNSAIAYWKQAALEQQLAAASLRSLATNSGESSVLAQQDLELYYLVARNSNAEYLRALRAGGKYRGN